MIPKINKRFIVLAVSVALTGFLIWTGIFKLLSDPSIPLLIPEAGASWIQLDEPMDLVAKSPGLVQTFFRTRFIMDANAEKAFLKIRAMGFVQVFLNRQPIWMEKRESDNWKKQREIDLIPHLTPGRNELIIKVLNQKGPAVVLAHSQSLNLFSNRKWEASKDGKTWTFARSVDQPRPISLSRMFPRTDQALWSELYLLLSVFLIISLLTLLHQQVSPRFSWMERFTPTASGVRVFLLLAWGILAMNNIGKIPVYIGFDVKDHLDYIKYIAEQKRIPLATEGWQMFQSPLYYLLSAPLYNFFRPFFAEETVAKILRMIPLMCGLAQVEISYRTVRIAFPEKRDIQILGTVIGGLLPMNIYISQTIGNEALAGVFSASVVFLAFRILGNNTHIWPVGTITLLGLFLGLALLTKVTAVLLVPPIFLLFIYSFYIKDKNPRKALLSLMIVTGIIFVVAGWYYLRNWMEIGKPYMGGWDPARNISWWQDPGYRTPRDFFVFGESLIYPVYSAANGFWDSIYSTLWMDGFLGTTVQFQNRPPWNDNFMLGGIWLSLLPSIGILIGFFSAFSHPSREVKRKELFAAVCISIYFGALLYLFLTLPIYSTAKATYTLGLIPCYAILAARGLSLLMRNLYLRATIYSGIGCWALFAYLAYFVK